MYDVHLLWIQITNNQKEMILFCRKYEQILGISNGKLLLMLPSPNARLNLSFCKF